MRTVYFDGDVGLTSVLSRCHDKTTVVARVVFANALESKSPCEVGWFFDTHTRVVLDRCVGRDLEDLYLAICASSGLLPPYLQHCIYEQI